jgi:hypothetical protein
MGFTVVLHRVSIYLTMHQAGIACHVTNAACSSQTEHMKDLERQKRQCILLKSRIPELEKHHYCLIFLHEGSALGINFVSYSTHRRV